MQKPPCSNCLTLSPCKIRARDILDTTVLRCPMVREYLSDKHCRGMMYGEFRTERVKQIQKVMGFRCVE